MFGAASKKNPQNKRDVHSKNISDNVFQTLQTISSSHNYNVWMYDNIKKYLSGHVMDIGSGLGDIVQYYTRSNIDSVTLSDYSDQMVAYLKKKFSHLDRYFPLIMDISADNFYPDSAHTSKDTVTCINVLEHIEDDAKALRNMHCLLNKNGRLVLVVPACDQLYGTLDALVGHYRRYDKKELRRVLNEAGFVVTEQRYMNFLGIFTWFFSGRILKQKKFDEKACQRLDKFVPFLEKCEALLHPPIGQSLITVCSKLNH